MTYISQGLKDTLGAEVAAMVEALATAEVVDVAAMRAELAEVTAERDDALAKIAAAQAALA